MISDDVQRIELDARRRSLDEYKLRCQDLRTENDGLKQEKEQRETDALQIISFLRRDAERKDELIESLKATINQQRDLFAQQREEERQRRKDECVCVSDRCSLWPNQQLPALMISSTMLQSELSTS